MAWEEELIPASFRGIPFFIDTTTTDFGQRVQLNEYPFANTPNTVNLGRKARQYTFNAYVIGADYILDRNALMNAIEDVNTAGILTHPTLGIKKVYPTDQCQVIFNNKQGNWETFRLVFVEAGTNLFPSIGNDTRFQAAINAAEAAAAVYDEFKDKFQTKDYPDFIGGDAQTKLGDFASLIGTAAQSGVSNQDSFANLTLAINTFNENIANDYTDPVKIGTGIKDLISGLNDIYDSPQDVYNAQLKLTTYGNNYPPVSGSTFTTNVMRDNQNAMINIVQNLAIIQLALSTSNMIFDSRQDADVVRDQVASIIDNQLFRLGDLGDDVQFNALTDTLSAMVQDIAARSATLKNIIFVQVQDSIPAAVFAYDNYGTVNQEDAVVARNNIRHPLFMPALTPFEVLK